MLISLAWLSVDGRSVDATQVPGMLPAADVTSSRLAERNGLVRSLDGYLASLPDEAAVRRMDEFHGRALDMVASRQVREAFDRSREPAGEPPASRASQSRRADRNVCPNPPRNKICNLLVSPRRPGNMGRYSPAGLSHL